MKNINNKGFTLVEVIAAVVIISILLVLLIPNVNNLLERGSKEAYEELEKSILIAANNYVSENRYNIDVDGSGNVSNIGDIPLTDSKIPISILVENDYLSESGIDAAGNKYIVDPRDRTKKLNLNDSYVVVSFNSSKKKYEFTFESDSLEWE